MSPLSPPSSLLTPTTVRSPDLMLSVLSIKVVTSVLATVGSSWTTTATLGSLRYFPPRSSVSF